MISQLTMGCHWLPVGEVWLLLLMKMSLRQVNMGQLFGTLCKDANYSHEDVTPEHKFTIKEYLLFQIVNAQIYTYD